MGECTAVLLQYHHSGMQLRPSGVASLLLTSSLQWCAPRFQCMVFLCSEPLRPPLISFYLPFVGQQAPRPPLISFYLPFVGQQAPIIPVFAGLPAQPALYCGGGGEGFGCAPRRPFHR